MWDIKSVKTGSPDEVNKALKAGYEPFAVVGGMYTDTIWFKREVKDVFQEQAGRRGLSGKKEGKEKRVKLEKESKS